MKLRLYHGSPEETFVPTFGLGDERHDYGRGFYLTDSPELAKEWAVAANPLVNGWMHVYDLELDGLKVFDFESAGPLAWLAELMRHRAADESRYYRENAPKFIARHGVDVSGYDILRGWRADASYFYICKSFVRNNVGVDFLGELLKLGDFGIQHCLKTERAFRALVEVEAAKEIVVASDYHGRYGRRDTSARVSMYDLIERDPRNDLSRTFKDIVS